MNKNISTKYPLLYAENGATVFVPIECKNVIKIFTVGLEVRFQVFDFERDSYSNELDSWEIISDSEEVIGKIENGRCIIPLKRVSYTMYLIQGRTNQIERPKQGRKEPTMAKNTRKNAAAIRNSKSNNIKLLNAAEILRNECEVEISDITSAYADEYSATFLTTEDKYNVVYNKDCVSIFKGDPGVFEMSISNICTEDEANRKEWFDIPRTEKDKIYLEFDVFDLKDTEAFVNNMPWREGVIYVHDISLGKYGGCIHFPACDKIAELEFLIKQVMDALHIGGASYRQSCEIRIHKNDEVSTVEVGDLLLQILF